MIVGRTVLLRPFGDVGPFNPAFVTDFDPDTGLHHILWNGVDHDWVSISAASAFLETPLKGRPTQPGDYQCQDPASTALAEGARDDFVYCGCQSVDQ